MVLVRSLSLSIRLSLCLYLYLYRCLSVCLSCIYVSVAVSLSVCLVFMSLSLSVCLSRLSLSRLSPLSANFHDRYIADVSQTEMIYQHFHSFRCPAAHIPGTSELWTLLATSSVKCESLMRLFWSKSHLLRASIVQRVPAQPRNRCAWKRWWGSEGGVFSWSQAELVANYLPRILSRGGLNNVRLIVEELKLLCDVLTQGCKALTFRQYAIDQRIAFQGLHPHVIMCWGCANGAWSFAATDANPRDWYNVICLHCSRKFSIRDVNVKFVVSEANPHALEPFSLPTVRFFWHRSFVDLLDQHSL